MSPAELAILTARANAIYSKSEHERFSVHPVEKHQLHSPSPGGGKPGDKYRGG
jgi:hypothetical protein